MMLSSSSSCSSDAFRGISYRAGGGHSQAAPLYVIEDADAPPMVVAAAASHGNARFMATLYSTPAPAPLVPLASAAAAPAAVPESAAAAAFPRDAAARLSDNAFVQVRQRTAATHLSPSAALMSRSADVDVGQPAWCSSECSVLPHESSGREDSCASFTTATSLSGNRLGEAGVPNPVLSSTSRAAASAKARTFSPVRRDATYMTDLRRRVEAQTRPRQSRSGRGQAVRHAAAPAAATPPRREDAMPSPVRGARAACAVVARGPQHGTPSSDSSETGTTPARGGYHGAAGDCGGGQGWDDDVDSSGEVCSSCRPVEVRHVYLRPRRPRSGGSRISSSSNDAGSSSGGDGRADSRGASSAYCFECGCRCDACPEGCGDGDDDGSSGSDNSLCSACRAAAAAAAAAAAQHRPRSCDPFKKAMRTDGQWLEVPPLLHISAPARGSGAAAVGRLDDAAVQALREREERRQAYLRSAAVLQRTSVEGGQTGSDGAAASQGPCAVLPSHTSIDASSTEANATPTAPMAAAAAAAVDAAEREQRRSIAVAAAQCCAEVTLPLLQDELATHAARTAAEQCERLDAAVAQMRALHEEARGQDAAALAQEREALLQEKQELEAWRCAREAATVAAAARVEAGTSPIDATLLVSRSLSTTVPTAAPLDLPPPPPPLLSDASLQRGHVGTQHCDGTHELLVTVRADALAWVTQKLVELEGMQRDGIEQAESATRHVLLHGAERTCRRQLEQFQGEMLGYQREVLVQQQRATWSAALRTLEQQERLARLELTQEATLAWGEVTCGREKECRALVAASAHTQAAQLTRDLAAARGALESLQAVHADTQEHARQLRLQLVHALRMPTVTLADRSGAPRGGGGGDEGGALGAAAAAARAYAQATATCSSASDSAGRGEGVGSAGAVWQASSSASCAELEDLPVHRRFARAHQEALRVTRAQTRTV